MIVQELTLDQLGKVARGRSRHRPRDAAFLYGGPFPFVQTADVKRAGLHLKDYQQTYSEAGLAQSRLWPAGTLCITIAANIAETAILGIDACFPDSVIGFTADPEKADTRFVKYLFDAILKMRFRSFTQGAAQDNLSQEKLLSIKFPVPELPVQRRIADILSAYDELIENNRRRIVLLEEVAGMLYHEWFVRFRFPGHEHVKIVNGVPEGWTGTRLGSILTLKRGYDLPEGQRIPGEVPVMSSAGASGFHNQHKALSPGVVTGRYGTLGQVYYVERDYWPLNTALYVVDFQNTQPIMAFHLLRTLLKGFITEKAAVPGVDRNVLHALPVIWPPPNLQKDFVDVVSDCHGQVRALREMNAKLAQARDLLLPRLINGVIAV